MADGFEANDNDINIANHGLTLQFDAHGMDMAQPNVRALFNHLVKVQAQNACIQRELSAMLHPQ